jgi:hypothetical protein
MKNHEHESLAAGQNRRGSASSAYPFSPEVPMRAVVVALSFAALAACSGNPPLGGAPAPETIRVSGPGGGAVTVTSNAMAGVSIVAGPIAKVWRVLPFAYDSLGLAIVTLDSANHLIGNGDMKLRRQLGGVPLSRFLDCGNTQIGYNADSYDVVLTVRTQLRSDDSGATTMTTMVTAMAKPVAFSQAYSNCSSTGKLEMRLADAIRAKLKP